MKVLIFMSLFLTINSFAETEEIEILPTKTIAAHSAVAPVSLTKVWSMYLGQSNYSGATNSVNTSGSAMMASGFNVGVDYQINSLWSAGIGLNTLRTDYESAQILNLNAKISPINVELPANSNLKVFAVFGPAEKITGTLSASYSTGFEYGIGISADYNKSIGLILEHKEMGDFNRSAKVESISMLGYF